MALAQVSSSKSQRGYRSTVSVALVALAAAFAIIGNIAAAGSAVYRTHASIAQLR